MLNDTASAESYFDKAMERARAGDLDTAAEFFRQASDRGHAFAAYALASLLKDRGRFAEAVTQYRRALACGLPTDDQQLVAECETSLGYLRAQAGDDAEAERLYRAADARGYPDAAFNLGNLLSRTGRMREAEDTWRRAAAAGQADAAYNLAELMDERGDLEYAEHLLRQAMAAGITDAVNNLARIRLQRGDPTEAETLLRQAVTAGDHNAVFNLGIVLQVQGRLEEAEAMLRRAADAGHIEAAAHVDRLVTARMTQAAARHEVMVRPEPAPNASNVDGGWLSDLGVFFAEGSSTRDRMRAAREFVANARNRLQAAGNAAGQGRDILAERSAQLVSEIATRLPIRTLETLRQQAGDDPEAQSEHVIDGARRLAGALWAIAAAVPGPPPVVRAVKVIVHSAIEIRMIGELYAIHCAAVRDATWLGTVLLAWASGQPVAPGHSATASASVLVNKLRSSATDLTGNESRVATLANRGRAGTNMLVRCGTRMHRRMRLHPSSWARPDGRSIGKLMGEAVGTVAAERLAGRLPRALANAAHERFTSATHERSASATHERSASATPPFTSDEMAGQIAAGDPRDALAHAWQLHLRAAAVAQRASTSDVANRLSRTLAAQRRHLETLGRQLGRGTSPTPAQRGGQNLDGSESDAQRLAWRTEDAIDAVEDRGAQPRRLPSWSTRRRAALVYVVAAVACSLLPVAMLLGSSSLSTLVLLLAQCLVLPWVSLAAGAIAIGPLFRPWLGGPTPRHPLIGMGVVIGVHLGTGLCAAVIGTLL